MDKGEHGRKLREGELAVTIGIEGLEKPGEAIRVALELLLCSLWVSRGGVKIVMR